MCCILLGLPKSTTKQDLKDYMRDAGDIAFVDVFEDGTGSVEFVRYDDMKYAVKKLDDTKFKTQEVSIVVLYQFGFTLASIHLIYLYIIYIYIYYYYVLQFNVYYFQAVDSLF